MKNRSTNHSHVLATDDVNSRPPGRQDCGRRLADSARTASDNHRHACAITVEVRRNPRRGGGGKPSACKSLLAINEKLGEGREGKLGSHSPLPLFCVSDRPSTLSRHRRSLRSLLLSKCRHWQSAAHAERDGSAGSRSPGAKSTAQSESYSF